MYAFALPRHSTDTFTGLVLNSEHLLRCFQTIHTHIADHCQVSVAHGFQCAVAALLACGENLDEMVHKKSVRGLMAKITASKQRKFLPHLLCLTENLCHNIGLLSRARVVKLVDAGDSKSPAARRAGSIPAPGTNGFSTNRCFKPPHVFSQLHCTQASVLLRRVDFSPLGRVIACVLIIGLIIFKAN